MQTVLPIFMIGQKLRNLSTYILLRGDKILSVEILEYYEISDFLNFQKFEKNRQLTITPEY